jgi:hypothetical protein
VGGKEGEPNDTSGYFITGEILEMPESASPYYIGESPKTFISKTDIAKFPHLFRPMPWWEGRQPEDMPEYLRGSGSKGDVFFKVLQWRLCTDSLWQWINSTDGDTFYLQEYCTYQPSTSEEYEEFLKQKEGS